MACPGIIHRDRAADRQPAHQQLVLLGEELRVVATQERIDLAHGDSDAPLGQLLMQQGLGDLAVVVLIEHVAAQLRPEVPAVKARRQLAHAPLPVRGLPHLEAIANVVGRNAQLLHDEVTIPFEAGVRRQRLTRGDLDGLVNRQLLALAALRRARTLAVRLLGVRRLGRRVHTARLELRLRLLALEHGDLVAQLLNQLRLPQYLLDELLDLPEQSIHQRTALCLGDVRQLFVARHLYDGIKIKAPSYALL